MDIKLACEIVSGIAKDQNTGVLEVLNDWLFGRDADTGLNPDYGLTENRACRAFINAGAEFFSEVV